MPKKIIVLIIIALILAGVGWFMLDKKSKSSVQVQTKPTSPATSSLPEVKEYVPPGFEGKTLLTNVGVIQRVDLDKKLIVVTLLGLESSGEFILNASQLAKLEKEDKKDGKQETKVIALSDLAPKQTLRYAFVRGEDGSQIVATAKVINLGK